MFDTRVDLKRLEGQIQKFEEKPIETEELQIESETKNG